MNKKMIICSLGKLLKIDGILLLIPALVDLIYKENVGIYYAITGVIVFLVGALLSMEKPKKENFYAREGFILVALSWIIISFTGAVPFWLSREIPSYIDAFFEMVSGFTTTGSSILNDVESLSHASMFWRSFSHWIGGMGILVFVIAFIPIASNRSLHIFRAEMPGPIVGKLVSKARLTARILYLMYAFFTILEVIFLLAGGMPFFDALLNSFGTAGTGGFAIKNASIAAYNSAYVDWVITIFMILFGINFNIIYLVMLRKFKLAFHNEEVRWYFIIIIVATLLISWNILPMYSSFVEALRYAAFQVASIITTTGFATANFDLWPAFSKAILMLLIFIGACAGSTGGGIKVSRILMYFKSGKMELKKAVHPHSVTSIEMDNTQVEPSIINNIHGYLILYFMIFIISFMVLSFYNLDFESAFSAVATCLNNVGPGFNAVGPTCNFSGLSDVSKLVLSFDMLAGRLEIFPILILFAPSLWKK